MFAENVSPLLAARELSEDTAHKVTFPKFVSPKLDGIRALVLWDYLNKRPIVVSRSLKPIRSSFVQRTFARLELLGLDGELICGDPTDAQVFNKTTSAVMTIGSEEPVRFFVFDRVPLVGDEATPFFKRFYSATESIQTISGQWRDYLVPVGQIEHKYWQEVLDTEQECLSLGYEGLILRDGDSVYKFGRSTFKQQILLKLKRLKDSEAEIIGFTELQRNLNMPFIDALGYQKRSASKEGKVAAGTLGNLIVKDHYSGVMFEVGSGMDDAMRQEIWDNREQYLGQVITYKYFPIGVIDKPRHPIFKGFRNREDMS